MSAHEDRPHYIDALEEGLNPDIFLDPLLDTIPMEAFAMIVIATVGISMYSWTGSMLPGSILAALFGGILIMALPPQAAGVVVLIVAASVAIALYTIWRDR